MRRGSPEGYDNGGQDNPGFTRDSGTLGDSGRSRTEPTADYDGGDYTDMASAPNNNNNNNNTDFDDDGQHDRARYSPPPRNIHNMEEGSPPHNLHELSTSGGARSQGWGVVQTNFDLHRHRRAKTQAPRANGYDYFRRQHSVNDHNRNDVDNTSIQSLNFEDLQQTRRLLNTMKVWTTTRKSRRKSSKKKEGVVSPGDPDVDYGDESSEEGEEMVGLPSAREKTKSLAERLLMAKQGHSAREAAIRYRDCLDHDGAGTLTSSSTLPRGLRQAGFHFSDAFSRFNFWSQQFKEIEGKFGIATSTYFRFMRWLVKINLLVFLLFFGFIYIPQIVSDNIFDGQSRNLTQSNEFYEQTYKCTNSYKGYIKNITDKNDIKDTILDVISGTGMLADTMLFYGFYSNLSFWENSKDVVEIEKPFYADYNMGLAYLLTVGVSFVILFLLIVKNSSKTIKETVMDFDNQAFPKYANAVFGGWDYCIASDKMASFKQNIIYKEFIADIEEIKLKRKRDNRTSKEKLKLYLKRIGVNILVIAILAGCFYAIFKATDFLLEEQTEEHDFIVQLLIEYLPTIIISVFNFAIPLVFIFLAGIEEYSMNYRTRITIVRAVFLRLASVGVLIVSLYYRLESSQQDPYICPEENLANTTRCCGNKLWSIPDSNQKDEKGTVKCWETYVGQQFYKLAVGNFASVTGATLLVKLPRRIIYAKFKESFSLMAKIGLATFDLPVEVLDIVYSQTLCWIGMFFTPMMPAITLCKIFFFFFLKKFELLFMCETPKSAYKASRSYSFFQTMLLFSFIMIACLMGYMIGNIAPSKSCGPFRLYSSESHVMFSVVTNQINAWPDLPQKIVNFFGTLAFFVPAILIVLLSIYYYWATTQGYKRMEELLKEQLKSEAYDKQYLLARVDEVIKKGQLITNED